MATNREQQEQNHVTGPKAGVVPVAVPQPSADERKKAKANAEGPDHSTELGNIARQLDQLAQKMAAGAGGTSDGHSQLVAEVSALRDQANKALNPDEDRSV